MFACFLFSVLCGKVMWLHCMCDESGEGKILLFCLLSWDAAQCKDCNVQQQHCSHAEQVRERNRPKFLQRGVNSKHCISATKCRVRGVVLVAASLHSMYSASSFLWSCTPQLSMTACTLVLWLEVSSAITGCSLRRPAPPSATPTECAHTQQAL